MYAILNSEMLRYNTSFKKKKQKRGLGIYLAFDIYYILNYSFIHKVANFVKSQRCMRKIESKSINLKTSYKLI